MVRNLFFLILGAFSGLWFIWPQIITTKGWECTKDVIASSNEELTKRVEELERRVQHLEAVLQYQARKNK